MAVTHSAIERISCVRFSHTICRPQRHTIFFYSFEKIIENYHFNYFDVANCAQPVLETNRNCIKIQFIALCNRIHDTRCSNQTECHQNAHTSSTHRKDTAHVLFACFFFLLLSAFCHTFTRVARQSIFIIMCTRPNIQSLEFTYMCCQNRAVCLYDRFRR